jgi:hypothetical protein
MKTFDNEWIVEALGGDLSVDPHGPFIGPTEAGRHQRG